MDGRLWEVESGRNTELVTVHWEAGHIESNTLSHKEVRYRKDAKSV